MNLPANLPVTASAGSSTRADRAGQDDPAAMKFDDMLEKKPGKGVPGTADEHADSRRTTWSWTRIDLAKNRMEWSAGTEAEAVDPSRGKDADEDSIDASPEVTDGGSTEGWEGHAPDGGQSWPGGGASRTIADDAATGGETDQPPVRATEPDAAAGTEEPDKAVDEQDLPAAAGQVSPSDGQSPLPVQGDGESRQAAAMAAGEDRRLDPRAATRERSSSISERAQGTDRGDPAIREASRPAPVDGERSLQRLGAGGDVRTTEPRSDGQKREDLLRPDPFGQRVKVVASQTTPLTPPAPALTSLGLSSASVQVVAAISEDVGQASRAAATSIEAQDAAGARNRPVHTLQIQLQPADLGRVNARMSIDGAQLRVELQVETEQARAALTKDADTILKALKAAGFEIERVTVQQVQPASSAAQTGTQERGAGSFAAQGHGADESGSQRDQRGAGNHAGHGPQEGQDGASQRDTRGGLFI